MKNNIARILIELSDLPGPAGFEEVVAKRAKELLEPYLDETWIDVLGNAIGVRKCGKENAPKLIFDAHIDEIGFIITGVEEGFLRFARLGGLDPRNLPATGVMIMSDPPVYGVVSVLPPHILKTEDMEKNFKIEDLFIDTGLSQEEALKRIPPGTHGVIASKAKEFGKNMLCGKALDDRVGLATILRALELLEDADLNADLYVMASTQEEVGLRGATTGAYTIDADYAVIVEGGHVKTPDTKPVDTNELMHEGVIITRGPNMNDAFTEQVIDLAVKNGIKHQISVTPSGSSGTNARVIQISRRGVATVVIAVPMKYMHSAFEMVSLDDIEQTAGLLVATAKSMKGVSAL